MGKTAGPALPALIHALGDSEPDVRSCAASAAGNLGPEARSAVPALLPLLHDRYGHVRSSTRQAIEEIQAKP